MESTTPMAASNGESVRSSTPARLLEAAIDAIEQGGEQMVNVRHVAEACGVTTPVVYKAFGSREGLVVAAHAERFRRALADNVETFARAIDGAATVEDLRAVMVRMVTAVSDASRAESRRVQFEVLGAAVHRPDLRKAVDDALRVLIDQGAEALGRAKDRGLIRADVPLPEVVWWFIGQMQGRRLIEQTDAATDFEAWVGLATTSLLVVLFGP